MDKDFLELKRPDIKTAWQTKKIFWKKKCFKMNGVVQYLLCGPIIVGPPLGLGFYVSRHLT